MPVALVYITWLKPDLELGADFLHPDDVAETIAKLRQSGCTNIVIH